MADRQSAKPALLWLQSITCNGDAHSFFTHPDLFPLLARFELIHHPLIETAYDLDDVTTGTLPCDILILDGAYIEEGFTKNGVEVSWLIHTYAQRAQWIITVGTCATFGGIFSQKDPENISGFAYSGEEPTSRHDTYASKLISLPGCPAHPRWLGFVLEMLASGRHIQLDVLHRPVELYATTVHSGCVRNEYFEWKIDAHNFGTKEGCLFYQQGCQAPFTHGSCNHIPWNDVSSKTTVGTPCFGCTEPSFPRVGLFVTKTHMGIPATMPLSVPRRAYLTLTGIAKSFRIKRLETPLIPSKSTIATKETS